MGATGVEGLALVKDDVVWGKGCGLRRTVWVKELVRVMGAGRRARLRSSQVWTGRSQGCQKGRAGGWT